MTAPQLPATKILILAKPFEARIFKNLLSLMKLDQRAVVVEDAQTAQHLVLSEDFAAIVSDLKIGVLEIARLCRSLRGQDNQRRQRVPVIITADAITATDIALMRDSGVNSVLARPFSAHQIQRKLENSLLDRRPFVLSVCYSGPDRRKRMRRRPPAGPGWGTDRRTVKRGRRNSD